MTYKGYTIAAEERTSDLLNVNEDGRMTTVLVDGWDAGDCTYVVFKDELCDQLVEIGFDLFDDAKDYIDRLVAREGLPA